MTANEFLGWLFLALIAIAVWQGRHTSDKRRLHLDDRAVHDDLNTLGKLRRRGGA